MYTSEIAILTGTMTIYWNKRYHIFGQTHAVGRFRALQDFRAQLSVEFVAKRSKPAKLRD